MLCVLIQNITALMNTLLIIVVVVIVVVIDILRHLNWYVLFFCVFPIALCPVEEFNCYILTLHSNLSFTCKLIP